jgi:hypothetical protein
MLKKILFFSALLFTGFVDAQVITEKDLSELLGETSSKTSSLNISAGIGNGIFSKRNNALNADQESLKKTFYTATAAYYHKSGAGLSLSTSLLDDVSGFSNYQTAVNPFYYFENKNIYTGLSYTRFIKGNGISFVSNPFQNEISGSFKWLKTVVRPSIQLQYSNGKTNETFDTTIITNVPPPAHALKITDNISTDVKDFTIALSGDHQFTGSKMFFKADEFSFIPALTINTGSSYSKTTHSATFLSARKKNGGLKSRSNTQSDKSNFELQSVAISGEFYYSIGKVFIETQVYSDYYIPSTDTKRVSTVFSISAGLTF